MCRGGGGGTYLCKVRYSFGHFSLPKRAQPIQSLFLLLLLLSIFRNNPGPPMLQVKRDM